MQPPASTLVERSSDAIAVIRLEDGVIIDTNQTFSTLMGFAQKELLGRNGCDLFVCIGPASLAATLNALRGHVVIDAVPAGFRTQSRELQVGRLSALILDVDGQPHALCTLRGSRNPVSWERCIAVRVELVRLLEGGASPGMTVRALQALGEYLQWDLSAFWRPDPLRESLDCAAVWRSPSIKWTWPKESSREATFPHDGSLLRSVWLSGRPVWVPDVSRERRSPRTTETDGGPMRGCLAFPVVAGNGVLGVVQLVSSESREPESNLLGMVDEFGRLLGRLVQDSSDQTSRGLEVSRLGRRPTGRSPSLTDEPRELLRELADTVGRLGDLMRSIADPAKDDSTAEMPAERTASSDLRRQPPFGVTLKTVSERTGVPAATLRTWERRYRVLRPRRSANGYRLYAEDDITRILQVTKLLNRGMQVSDAMAAVGEPIAEPTSNSKGASAPQAPFRSTDDFLIEAGAQVRDGERRVRDHR